MLKSEFISEQYGKVCLHIWEPDGEVKQLYQICHGMSEYVLRYDEFAKRLNEKGVLVFGIDHPGHGESDGVRGFFADKDGWKYLCECNVHASQIMKERYPDKKLTLMGHSMGSFVARTIAGYYPDTANEYIFMGTAGPNPALGVGNALANVLTLFARRKESNVLYSLSTGPYAKAEKTYKTPFDWLNTVDAEVQNYIDDENYGFKFTTAGYRDLFRGLMMIDPKKWAPMLDKSKKYLLVAGDKDPVGDMGKGVSAVYDAMKEAGVEDTTLIFYEGCRHEILKDALKEKTMSDIMSFIGLGE
ncbi:MAG: alpha/beta fold hydrolase [Clostridiales bacterium]|nr:alpha/beta fold hydrolase [Clostridiales bacterium]